MRPLKDQLTIKWDISSRDFTLLEDKRYTYREPVGLVNLDMKYTHGEKTDCKRLWKDLWASGQSQGMIFSSMQAMNIRRIEAGIFDNGSDFDTSVSPADAGLSRFVDMDKDYFIGRQALLTRGRRHILLGVLCNGYIPEAGDLVYFKIGALDTLQPELIPQNLKPALVMPGWISMRATLAAS